MSRTRPPAAVAEVADRLAHAAVRLARRLRQQDTGELTPTMRATLGTIAREGPLTLGELAAIERVAPPTITKVLGKLEETGLVERVVDAGDRRVARVSLTATGRRWLDGEWTRRRDWLTEQLVGLDPDALDRLVAAVDVIEQLTAPEPPASP
ncbi:MAG TPA: MarR family winged helix-turn-helix transcriptional regulator [Acidimicrobiales bacterium]|nr:MarR family winged helix-turn-helix transcriptional regulator [Acidimicrobiales bacterium]